MPRVYLGLGSNLGDRREQLRAALRALSEHGVVVEAASSLYESDPMYEVDQPPFLNAVVAAQTELLPEELLRAAKDVEGQLGRQPRARNGPRELDIDILMYGDRQLDTPELTLPHPRMHERPFVLIPLAELRGSAVKAEAGLRPIEAPEWAGQ